MFSLGICVSCHSWKHRKCESKENSPLSWALECFQIFTNFGNNFLWKLVIFVTIRSYLLLKTKTIFQWIAAAILSAVLTLAEELQLWKDPTTTTQSTFCRKLSSGLTYTLGTASPCPEQQGQPPGLTYILGSSLTSSSTSGAASRTNIHPGEQPHMDNFHKDQDFETNWAITWVCGTG